MFGFALPTVSSAVLRVNQVLALIVAVRLASPSERDFVAAAFGVMTAAAIFSDSGAVNYVLTRGVRWPSRRVLQFASLTHVGIGSIGLSLALVLLAARAPTSTTASLWVVLIAVGVAQVLDSLMRVIRSPLLLFGKDAMFAVPELVLGIAKLGVLGAALGLGSMVPFLALPVLSGAVALGAYLRVSPHLDDRERPRMREVVPQVLQHGVAGAASGLYSQLPVIIAAAMLPLSGSAMLSVAYRVVQPLELVPASVSQQLLPRVHAHTNRLPRIWMAFVAYGLVGALAVIATGGLLMEVVGISKWDQQVLAVVASSLVLKSGNYLLVSVLLAHGGVVQRFYVTVTVGVLAAVWLLGAGAVGSPILMACVSPASELVLALGLVAVIVGRRRKDGTSRLSLR